MFESAKKKHCDGIQDGAETTKDSTSKKLSTLSTCSLTLKPRRSVQTAADDIQELCLYMFGHRNTFPKSCLSSVTQSKPKQPKQVTVPDVTDAMLPEALPTPITLEDIFKAISQVQADIKLLDCKFTAQIATISDQISVSFLSERETIAQLEKERDALHSTIDMLMSPSSRGADAHSKRQPCAPSRNRSPLPLRPSQPSQVPPMTVTSNPFAVLEPEDVDQVTGDDAISVDSLTEAELLIDTYYDALNPTDQAGQTHGSQATPPKQPDPSTKKRASFQEQLDHYCTKHRELNAAKTKPPVSKKMQSPTPQPIINADILIIGDSVIKRLLPRRLSRKTKVICHTMRGAKIEDLAPNAKHMSTKHGVSEIILHVGTNNTYDSPEKIDAKITSLCETLPTTSVTISSIIHRKNQSVSQCKKVDDSNDLLKSIAKRNNWGFIDNGNINSDHLVSDGVHLNSRGVGLFAKNIIQHIAGPSEETDRHTPQRTPFGEILFAEALKKPAVGYRDRPTVFQRSNQHYPYSQPKRLQPTHCQPRPKMFQTKIMHTQRDHEWRQYLKQVKELLNPQNRDPK